MKARKLIHSLAAGAIAVAFASGASAMDSVSHARDTDAPLGTPAQAALASRIIRLGIGSEYVNVNRGEVVTIVNGENAFTWMFDTLGTPSFELAKIAPQDFGTGHLRVYVAPDPNYLSD